MLTSIHFALGNRTWRREQDTILSQTFLLAENSCSDYLEEVNRREENEEVEFEDVRPGISRKRRGKWPPAHRRERLP